MKMLTVYFFMGIAAALTGTIVGKTIAAISNLISKHGKGW